MAITDCLHIKWMWNLDSQQYNSSLLKEKRYNLKKKVKKSTEVWFRMKGMPNKTALNRQLILKEKCLCHS